MSWGNGSSWKNRLFSRTVKNSKKAKHSFVGAWITHYPKPVRCYDSQQQVLPFLLEDFLLVSDSMESRDNICMIGKHQIDRNHTCIWQSLIFLVLKCQRQTTPIFFWLNHFGAHALIFLRMFLTLWRTFQRRNVDMFCETVARLWQYFVTQDRSIRKRIFLRIILQLSS